MAFPTKASHVIIGAGIHGLGTAWHLAAGLKAAGRRGDVLVIDKGGIGADKLVAEDMLGRGAALLEPFRFSRYAQGKPHPVSHSPFPWS